MNWQSNVKGTKRLQYYHDCFDNVFTEKMIKNNHRGKKLIKNVKNNLTTAKREWIILGWIILSCHSPF